MFSESSSSRTTARSTPSKASSDRGTDHERKELTHGIARRRPPLQRSGLRHHRPSHAGRADPGRAGDPGPRSGRRPSRLLPVEQHDLHVQLAHQSARTADGASQVGPVVRQHRGTARLVVDRDVRPRRSRLRMRVGSGSPMPTRSPVRNPACPRCGVPSRCRNSGGRPCRNHPHRTSRSPATTSKASSPGKPRSCTGR